MQQLIARTPQQFASNQDITVNVRHLVEMIDRTERRIQVRSLETGRSRQVPFDSLLIATGSVPICPPVAGIDAAGIYTVNTLQQGIDLRTILDQNLVKRVVVVGAGPIGLEMAENLVARGLDVAMIDLASQVLPLLDSDMAIPVARELEALGVHLYLNERLEGFETRNGTVTGVVTPRRTLPADIVILGLGVRPNTKLGAEAGLTLGEKGAIHVTDGLQTSDSGVWAAGDCVATRHVVTGKPVYVALGTVANKQGRIAGINMAGGNLAFPGVAGTAITRVGRSEIARTGLHTADCEGLNLNAVSTTIESTTRAPYYPGAEPMTVKLLAEKGSGRLLGGQIVGGTGAAKRIDVIVTALFTAMTVDRFVNLDLAYAPPFSPTWDPILIAARNLLRQI